MTNRKQNQPIKINGKVLKPILFAVIRSRRNQAFHPLVDCVLVVDNTQKSTITIESNSDGPIKSFRTVTLRSNVLFYTHTDLRQAVKELNTLVESAYKEHMENVDRLLEAFKNANEPV